MIHSMRNQRFIVKQADRGSLLIDFLSSRLKASKKRAKRLLDNRNVFVNNRRIWMAKHKLTVGDTVEFQVAEGTSEKIKPKILFEDTALLIVDKPPGILSVGDQSLEQLLRKTSNLPSLRAVHRLDRDTSGCFLLVKTTAAQNGMIKLFSVHKILKIYQAVVRGKVAPDLKMVRQAIGGKHALTRLEVLSSNPTASHVKINMASGRTHQIRRHMASVGHPVLGDRSYGTQAHESERLRAIPRQILHATSISFPHPITHKPLRVKAPLPGDFRSILKAFKLT